jgi:hypothetical protein
MSARGCGEGALGSVWSMSPLQNLKVATPCSEIWEEMKGDDRVRHCARCRFNVYDLSAMTTSEAEQLLGSTEGKLCVTFFQRADGRVLTKDCRGGFSGRFWKRVDAARHRKLMVRVAVAVSAFVVAGVLTGGEKVRRALGLTVDPPPTLVSKYRPSDRLMGKRIVAFPEENSGY